MRLFRLLPLAAALLAAKINTPHIKAAVSAYEEAKEALLKKQTTAAIELLNKAIQIEPTFLDAYKSLIEVRAASGDRLETAAVITRFLEIEPNSTHYRLLLGQLLLEENQWERSLAQFSLLLRKDPFNADALLGFAAAARRLGMEDRASEALVRGRNHYPLDRRFRNP